jgi:predicted enzyme related to lactoylglutathione lyase
MDGVYYFEIQADNPEKTAQFYHEIFGWECTKDDSLPIEYFRVRTENINGGILKRPAPAPKGEMGTNAYVNSMKVESFDETAEKILSLGGIVALPKFAIPGKCWQGYFQDPEGNTFGLFQVDENAK